MESSLSQRAYEYLHCKLLRGEIPPGSQLVNRTLAREIGISFTPVREAINRLASEGLVEHLHGAGAYVRRVDRQDLAQLFDLQENFEPFAASEAARHITRDEVDLLTSLCEKIKGIVSDIRIEGKEQANRHQRHRWIDHDSRFYSLLVCASHNPWLIKIITDLRTNTQTFCSQYGDASVLPLSKADRNVQTYESLIAALREHNSDTARLLMREHILFTRESVFKNLDPLIVETNGNSLLSSVQ